MWSIFKAKVLRAMVSGKYTKDMDAFAEFFADEYDKAIKRGGTMLHGVPVLNANKKGFADVLKRALKKGQQSDGENFNLLMEIYPAAFDAYWLGAEMAPFPNPLIKPLGWIMTPPAPGAVTNIGPNPISLASSAARNAIILAAALAIEETLKNVEIETKDCGKIKPFEAALRLSKGKAVPPDIAKLPEVIAAKEVISLVKMVKSRRPSIGAQFKPSIKFPFPKPPSKKEMIKKAKAKLKEEAAKKIKEQLEEAAKDTIATSIARTIFTQIQSTITKNG